MEDTKITRTNMKRTTPKERKSLIKKSKGWIFTYNNVAEFKEPIAILLRRTGRAEFFEEVNSGEWTIKHSDGKNRVLFLDPRFIHTFKYGKKEFRGYVCHEDFPTPLPEDPVITAEMVGIVTEKTLHDLNKWKAQEWTAKGDFIWKIALGIAALVGMYILYKMLVPSPTGVGASVAQTVAENITNATSGVTDITPTVFR